MPGILLNQSHLCRFCASFEVLSHRLRRVVLPPVPARNAAPIRNVDPRDILLAASHLSSKTKPYQAPQFRENAVPACAKNHCHAQNLLAKAFAGLSQNLLFAAGGTQGRDACSEPGLHLVVDLLSFGSVCGRVERAHGYVNLRDTVRLPNRLDGDGLVLRVARLKCARGPVLPGFSYGHLQFLQGGVGRVPRPARRYLICHL